MKSFVGVDGCQGGWLVAVLDAQVQELTFDRFVTLAEVLAAFPQSTIGIDIPIGLWDKGDRPCDREARKRLQPYRGSSVFPAPIASILDCSIYAEANAQSKDSIGKGISQQAFALFPKMREARKLVTADIQDRVFEVHPEVCFWALEERPMVNPKRFAEGYEERRFLLDRHLDLDEPLPGRDHMARLVRLFKAQPDDALDAAVAAWTARRVALGTADRLGGELATGDGPSRLRMEMVY